MNQNNNQWDVFISHASEDKPFADRVASLLKEAALKVWYDTYVLKLGDSLTDQINDGLANSRFGIVIISRTFFSKDWPKRELAALFNIEINNQKAILPIWHDITYDEIRKVAPLLLDKVASNSEKDGLDKIIHDILRVIKPEKFNSDISPDTIKISYKNNTDLIVMPLRPYQEHVIAIGRYPVTNKQYQKFLINADREILHQLFWKFFKQTLLINKKFIWQTLSDPSVVTI